jgi:DNA-3-methyladenine glycosylase II
MTTFTLPRPEGFSLQALASFLAGFVPGSGMAHMAARDLTLAFRLDKTFEPVLVEVREEGYTLVARSTPASDLELVRRQVQRIAGLDQDAAAWAALGKRDAIVGALKAEFAGFFTAAKPSPYDAAAWGVLVPRMPMRAAATLKRAIAEKHGDTLRLGSSVHPVFPGPAQLLALESFPGLTGEKLSRLHAVASAALEGRLGVDRLRAMGPDRALDDLQRIRGVGPWTASHIYFRGAAPADALPTLEPRVLHGLSHILGGEPVDEGAFSRYAEHWRPFRMWVCVLLARHLAAAGGWNRPGYAAERAAASKRTRKAGRATAPPTERA